MKDIKLTTAVADAAEKQSARYVIWDSELPGFGLRVQPTGSKSWVVKYRPDGGGRGKTSRWLTLGCPATMSGKEARAAAKTALAAVQLGGDPMGARDEKRRAVTIQQLIDIYEQEGCVVQRGARIGEAMKERTKQFTLSRLRNHVVPLLGKRRASDTTAGDIENLALAITKGKTARDERIGPRQRIIVRGGPGAARKVIRDLSAVFAFAERRKLVTTNPVATASVRKTDNKRERFLTLEEVSRLGAALDELEQDGVNFKAVNIARLLAVTGCRRDEIAGLKWIEVDLANAVLLLDETKTGRSRRPLGTAARALLASLRRQAEDDAVFVFPAERGSGFYQGTKKVWAEAVRRAGLPGVTPHILRHTVGSLAASAGEPMLMIGSILGHSNARSTAIYAHIGDNPARLAADRVSGALAAALKI